MNSKWVQRFALIFDIWWEKQSKEYLFWYLTFDLMRKAKQRVSVVHWNFLATLWWRWPTTRGRDPTIRRRPFFFWREDFVHLLFVCICCRCFACDVELLTELLKKISSFVSPCLQQQKDYFYRWSRSDVALSVIKASSFFLFICCRNCVGSALGFPEGVEGK